MKKILLLEPDKEQSELLATWLKGENYKITAVFTPEEAAGCVSRDTVDLLIMDIDSSETTELLLELCQTLKKDPRFPDLPVAVLTYGKDAKKIASSIEAGVDNFILKPFEADSFLRRLEAVFKEIKLKSKGKKVLDLNYINYLIKLTSERSREDFFLLSPVIFNSLIMDKVNSVLGEQVIIMMVKRLRELIGADYGFMKEIKFSGGQLLMDGVDKASKGISVEKLVIAFRDYVYGFLQLVQNLSSDILMERWER